jgi:ribosome biogenesis GTPase
MKNDEIKGRIVKATGGFYDVDTENGIVICRARGIFRKQGVSPLVGDMALVELTEQANGVLTGVLPRKNFLVRPSVANVDRVILVVAAADPLPNLMVIDRLIAIAQHKEIDTALVITKQDIDPNKAQELQRLYRQAGHEAVCVNTLSGDADAVIPLIKGKLCVLAGNSGAGKSTLLNALYPTLELKTGEISKKLGRGRHTTRTTELFAMFGGLIADTPGFSSMEFDKQRSIKKEDLEYCFREFLPLIGKCKYTGCSHTSEAGCAVLLALKAGEIAPSRHESYKTMYEEALTVRDWEVKRE